MAAVGYVIDGDVLLADKTWTDQTGSRRIPKRGSMDVDYVAVVNGAVYKTLQEALDVADGQTITIVKDIALDAPLVLSQGSSVTLDLGGNTLSGGDIAIRMFNGGSDNEPDGYRWNSHQH